MSTHTVHPDIHTHGLADGCPRCKEHAENPVNDLDPENLRVLVDLAVNRNLSPRTETEAVAVANVLTQMERFGKIVEAYPEEALSYLGRWGVDIIGYELGGQALERARLYEVT